MASSCVPQGALLWALHSWTLVAQFAKAVGMMPFLVADQYSISLPVNCYVVESPNQPASNCYEAGWDTHRHHNYRQIFTRHTKIKNLKCFLSRLAVVFVQSIEARYWVENEDVVGAAPRGDAPTTSQWSTISLPTGVHLILEVLRYDLLRCWEVISSQHNNLSIPVKSKLS